LKKKKKITPNKFLKHQKKRISKFYFLKKYLINKIKFFNPNFLQ